MSKNSKPRRVRKVRRIPVGKRMDVTREEFNRVIEMLNERSTIMNDLAHNQDVHLRRLGQLQAELDLIKRAWERLRTERL